MNFKHLLGAAALLGLGFSANAADYPSGYTKCVQNTGATCTMTGTRSTALGKNDVFVYAVKTGSFVCSSANYPTNTYPASAWCSYSNTTTSSSSSVASSVASSSSSSKSSSSVASSVASSSVASSVASSSVASSSSSTTTSNQCVGGATLTNVTVDCGGKTIGTACSGDGEGQAPVFTLNNATIKNVRLAAGKAGDGIHCVGGNCRLENVVWEDVCEDAASNLSEGGTMTVSGGAAYEAKDKVFQHNSKNSLTVIENFSVTNMGKLWRSCGDCTNNGGPRSVSINNVTIYGKVGDTVAGGNRNYGDKITIRNLKVQGYVAPKPTSSNPNQSSPKICVEYNGVTNHNGSSTSLGQTWNGAVCDISQSDVTAF
ncbi:MAG: pectate lyase [Rhodocyclaceae bacterium]